MRSSPDTQLLNKIRGGILGAAVGDALGGPVEGLPFTEIDRLHGRVTGFQPYHRRPQNTTNGATLPAATPTIHA